MTAVPTVVRRSLMALETEFWALVDTANERDAEASRINDDDSAEPVDSNRYVELDYLAICDLVTQNPDSRDLFVRCFCELMLWQRKSPWMLVPFCMRVLRLPEVRSALAHDMDSNKGTAYYARRMNYCSSIVHAYLDDVWEDAFMFDTFSQV